jgi:hypothetical protein
VWEHNPFREFAHDGLEQAAKDAAVRWSQPVELIRFLLMAAVRHMPASVRPWREIVMLGGPGDRSTAVVALNDWAEPPRLLRWGSAIYQLTDLGGQSSMKVYLHAANSEADTDPELLDEPISAERGGGRGNGDGRGGEDDGMDAQWAPTMPLS